MRHQDLQLNHILESWTYPNTIARTGASGFVTGDVGRIAYQQDTKQYWRLASTVPDWQPITGILSTGTGPSTSPSSTTNTSFTMMGLGSAATLIPTLSGKALVFACGSARNSDVGANGGQIQMYYGTGTAPTNGAAAPGGGTAISAAILFRNSSDSSNCIFPYTLVGVLTSLAIGTTYWFDIGIAVSGTGTCTLTQNHFKIVELP